MNLWTLARQLGNAKNTELDKTNPIINGDTTEYNRLYVPTIDAVSGKTTFKEELAEYGVIFSSISDSVRIFASLT